MPGAVQTVIVPSGGAQLLGSFTTTDNTPVDFTVYRSQPNRLYSAYVYVTGARSDFSQGYAVLDMRNFITDAAGAMTALSALVMQNLANTIVGANTNLVTGMGRIRLLVVGALGVTVYWSVWATIFEQAAP